MARKKIDLGGLVWAGGEKYGAEGYETSGEMEYNLDGYAG